MVLINAPVRDMHWRNRSPFDRAQDERGLLWGAVTIHALRVVMHWRNRSPFERLRVNGIVGGLKAWGICLQVALLLFLRPAEALPLQDYRHDTALAREAHAIATEAAHDYLFEGRRPEKSLKVRDRRLTVPGGVFVTITRDGKTRGCWGTVHPQRATLAEEIAVASVKALRYDYRHQPIARSEWPALRFYVSLVGPMVPVASAAEISPLRDGLFVTARGRGGVLLPGEARTARYQVAECRKKAGLKPREPALMYRFATVVFGPESEKQL